MPRLNAAAPAGTVVRCMKCPVSRRRGAWGAACLAVALSACGGSPCGIDATRPVFLTDTLPGAVVGTPYSAVIEVEIAHDPQDDFYGYAFSVSGSLPPGLQPGQNGDERRLTLAGTPTEAGDYGFDVRVWASEPGWYYYSMGDDLCRHDAERSYRITATPAAAAP